MKYSKSLSAVGFMAVFAIASTEASAECTKTCRNAITPHLIACSGQVVNQTMTPLQCAQQSYTAAGEACSTSLQADCKAYVNQYVPGLL